MTPTSDSRKTAPYPPLSVFSFLVALSYLFDYGRQSSWFFSPEWWQSGSPFQVDPLIELVLFVSGLWLVVRPGSVHRLVACSAINAIGVFLLLPRVGNHWMVSAMASVTVVVAYLHLRLGNSKAPINGQRLYEAFGGVLRMTLLVLYFWVSFHKLNRDFLDPDLSCALEVLRPYIAKFTIDAVPTWSAYSAIFGTLALEATIPILLCIRKTRKIGVVVGILFQCLIGLNLPGFASLMFALLSLYAFPGPARPGPASHPTAERFSVGLHPDLRDRPGLQLLAVLIVGAAFQWMLAAREPVLLRLSPFDLGILTYFAVCAYLAIARFFSHRGKDNRSGLQLFCAPMLAIWAIPALLFVNGLSPYLGIKNTLSYSMYSNLRTEADLSNHWIVPSSVQVFDNLRDLVQVIDSSDPDLQQFTRPGRYISWNYTYALNRGRDFEFALPYLMLRIRIAELARNGEEDIRVKFRRDGQVFSHDHAERDPELTSTSYWAQKFIVLRGVPNTNRGICMW